MTKRQKALMYGGGVCLLLGMVGYIAAAVMNIVNTAQMDMDIKNLLLALGRTLVPLLLMAGAAFVAGAGTFISKLKMVQGFTYAAGALLAFVAAIIYGRVSWFVLVLCFGLVCLATLLGEKFPAQKLGLLFAYLPALFLLIDIISTLGVLFRFAVNGMPLVHILGRQCVMLVTGLFMGAGFMCIGSAFADAKPAKLSTLVSRVGAIGVAAAPLGILLIAAAFGLQALLLNNGLAMRVAGIFAIILLVLAAILLVAGILLLPLAILYPLWDKEAIAAKKAAKAEEKKTEAAE